MKISKFVAIGLIALVLALPVAGKAADLPKFVYLATNPQGSVYYTFGSIFAQVLDSHSGIKARVQPSGGSSAYIPAISQGKIELGINNVNDVRLAYEGVAPFISSPNIRAITVVCPLVTGMLVRNDSDIKTMADVRGKRVASKFPAQISIHKCIESKLAASDLTYKDVIEVPVENINMGVQALVEKRLDVTSISIYAAQTKEADATIPGGIRFLSINGSPEGAAKMAAIFPGAYPIAIKANATGTSGIREDIVTQAYDILLIGSTHLSDDAGYAITKALYDHITEVQKGHTMLSSFTKENMVKITTTIPYHEGAIRYYKEAGLWSTEMDKVQQELVSMLK